MLTGAFMRGARRFGSALGSRPCLAAAFAALLASAPATAQNDRIDDLLAAVVQVKTHINPDGRTVDGLGREREGSAILIDQDGLLLTIGYLMVEAYAAEITDNTGRTVSANVVGYDHESGFGLLRTVEPLKLKPMPLGKSADVKHGDPVLIGSFGGSAMAGAAYVVAKREFAGSWEYMLDDALFTAPPLQAGCGGADKTPGNMFVPIDRLAPILGDLIAGGRIAGPGRPWLGVNTDELRGHLFVTRVTPGGPADKAGIRRGDIIVGVNGEQPTSLADFYRKVWARGNAGATVGLEVLQDREVRQIDVKSINRLDHLKLKSSF